MAADELGNAILRYNVEKSAQEEARVEEMKLAPVLREVEIRYRIPEPIFMNKVLAGACYEPRHKVFQDRKSHAS